MPIYANMVLVNRCIQTHIYIEKEIRIDFDVILKLFFTVSISMIIRKGV